MPKYKYNTFLSPCLAFLAVVYFLSACKKDSTEQSANPYDSWTTSTRGTSIPDIAIDPNTIQGLHKNIFKPTCANSGCHDGNFEPDFRSIESSYNSLIGRLVTNTDPNRTDIVHRVEPGDADKSMLLHRINTFIPGTQGQMPLSLEPDSDWPSKKLQYLNNIKQWINDGAKDGFGKTAASQDFKPQPAGLIVFANGSSVPLAHYPNQPVELPPGTTSIKIMVAYSDDKTAVNAFGNTTLNYSLNPNAYLNAENTMTKEGAAYTAKGFLGGLVDYWHSITLQLSTMGVMPNDVIWIRTQTTDNVNPLVNIPDVNTSFNIKKYFAIRIK